MSVGKWYNGVKRVFSCCYQNSIEASSKVSAALLRCSQCSFASQSQGHVEIHHKYQHGTSKVKQSVAQQSPLVSPFNRSKKLAIRTTSATKLLGRIKARICKSKTLFSHPEALESKTDLNNLSLASECTSKALNENMDSIVSMEPASPNLEDTKETFACHLCSFDADRITTLDRHLLNHHKIGLDNLLKLVMAKTKDGLSDERNSTIYGIRQPYYRPQNEMIEEGEFIIETVTPQIKILKHASTNTEDNDLKEFNLEKNCELISKEIEDMLNGGKNCDNADFLSKMQTLNEYMCKFVDSSKTLKKVLTKEFDSKVNMKERYVSGEPFFDLDLGGPETPRNWERALSEKMERTRNKYGDSRPNKAKQSSESFYY